MRDRDIWLQFAVAIAGGLEAGAGEDSTNKDKIAEYVSVRADALLRAYKARFPMEADDNG